MGLHFLFRSLSFPRNNQSPLRSFSIHCVNECSNSGFILVCFQWLCGVDVAVVVAMFFVSLG